jgi:hypothetical protein
MPFWFHVICVSTNALQWFRGDVAGSDGSINLIVPIAFSLQAV